MEGPLALCRFAQFASLLFLFGASLHIAAFAPADLARDLGRRLWRPAIGAAFVAMLAGLIWLPLESASMGAGWADAANLSKWNDVRMGTEFGALWQARCALLAFLLVAVAFARGGHWAWVVAASALALASLAFTGHARLQDGWLGALHRANDATHLLAAGAWVGGLVAFALDLARYDDPALGAFARLAARRYSAWGHGFVALVVATGVANAAMTLQVPTPLVASPYRALLLAKIVVVAAMVLTALFNRYVLVPRLSRDGRALGALKANGLAEVVGAAVVVGLVSVFGQLSPM